METAKNVLCDWILKSGDFDDLSFCLDLSSELQTFWRRESQHVQEVVSHVNTQLNSSSDRSKGLVVLKSLLRQCSSEVFMHNAVKWLSMLLNCLQSHDRAIVKKLACHNVQIILEKATSFSEISRDISTSVVPKLVPSFLIANQQWQSHSLQCLLACMTHYPGSCGPFKNKAETLAINILDNDQSHLCKLAAQVYASSTCCGGGGNHGIKHTEAWALQCDRLIVTLNQVLDDLYECLQLEGKSTKDFNAEPLQLGCVPDKEPKRSIKLSNRFNNLCLFLQELVSLNVSLLAKIPVVDILDIACQATSVSHKLLLNRPTTEKLVLSTILPVIHTSALQLVNCLITRCKKNLSCHTREINYIFVQLLSWTQTSDIVKGQQRNYGHLRSQIYITLQTWAVTLGPLSGLLSVMDQLIPHFISEIKPMSDAIKLTSGGATSSSGNRKRKHQSSQQLDSNIAGQSHSDPFANRDVIFTALKGLRGIIYCCGSQFKAKHFKDLVEVVLHILHNVQQNPDSPPVPYCDVECLAELYHVLLALVLNPPPAALLPTHLAIWHFSKGQNHHDMLVSASCREALAACQVIIHPKTAYLQRQCQPDKEVYPTSQDQKQSFISPGLTSFTVPSANGRTGPQFGETITISHPNVPSGKVYDVAAKNLAPTARLTSESPVQAYVNFESVSRTDDVQKGATNSERSFCVEKQTLPTTDSVMDELCQNASEINSDLEDDSLDTTEDNIDALSADSLEISAKKPKINKEERPETSLKKSKLDSVSDGETNGNPVNSDISYMLQSFVDCDPDSD